MRGQQGVVQDRYDLHGDKLPVISNFVSPTAHDGPGGIAKSALVIAL
jgi:hypothetical protein